MDSYFDKKIIELVEKIDDLIKSLELENNKITNFINNQLPNSELFYKDLQGLYIEIKREIEINLHKYYVFNKNLIDLLNLKKTKLNTDIEINEISPPNLEYDKLIKKLNECINTHNSRNNDFKMAKEISQKKLKDDSLFKFLLYIDYEYTAKKLLSVLIKKI